MKMDMKYAVVIVTYNREQLLRECIDNVKSQTIAAACIIVVNNASTDGTPVYLEELKNCNEIFDIIDLPKNIGGAGGFSKGIERALEKDVDCILIIDDDAMVSADYMEQILYARQCQQRYRAFAGTVRTDGKIDTFHRRKLLRTGLRTENCKEQEYQQSCFVCDIASFCGMVVDTDLVRQIGLPHADYFIWYDDTEYCLRIHQYSEILVVTAAELNHKTVRSDAVYPRKYDWKDYFAVRNRLLMVKEHGNFLDRAVNFADIFIHVIFRNWLFGMIKKGCYNWKYERRLVAEAIRNAGSQERKNVIIRRDNLN